MAFNRNLFAVIAGVLSAGLIALILLPVVSIIFDNFFHLFLFTTPPKDAWKDDLIVQITIMLWFFISTMSGGITCTLIAVGKEWRCVVIIMLIIIVTITILTKGDIFPDPILESVLVMLMIPLGFIMGRWMGMRIKAKQARKKLTEIEFKNTSSSSETNNQSL